MRALSEPSRLAAAVFLLLVAATIGAFFVAQRLKHQDPLLRYRASDKAFSPNGDGIKDTARIRFRLPEADDVTVSILDDDGGTVARVATNKPLGKGAQQLRWDGQTDEGLLAPEDSYRVRVGLRDENRTDELPHRIKLDLQPPRPRIQPVGAPRNRPIVIDGLRHQAAVARVAAPARKPRFSVWRTDTARPREVVEQLPSAGKRKAAWDGKIRGRLAPPGTYMITADALDQAGNRGSAPVRLPPPPSGRAAGGVGVLVQPVAIIPPLSQVRPRSVVRIGVAAGGRRYSWSLRRLDGERVGRGRSSSTRLGVRIPDGPAGVLVLTVRTREGTARAPIPVLAPRPRPILVVLPTLTWQGRNDVDDSGDGLPDSLTRDREVQLERPFAGGRLPRGFTNSEAKLLAYLDRQKLRYELMTDLGLARAGGEPLSAHDGVILAGETRWLPEQLGDRLLSYVRGGGRVFSVGLDSLHRTMALGARTMSAPSERSEEDFLGASVAEPVRGSTTLLAETDEINMFTGTAGSLGSWSGWQVTNDLGPGRLVASAVDDEGERVFVAYRLGRGLVIRPGVLGWNAALDNDIAPPATTTRRVWTLLRR